jgi:hypothetical protein
VNKAQQGNFGASLIQVSMGVVVEAMERDRLKIDRAAATTDQQ